MAPQAKRSCQRLPHAQCRRASIFLGFHPFPQQHELVAAKTNRQIRVLLASAQALGNSGKQLVANEMAEVVVHYLELIEIQESEGKTIAAVHLLAFKSPAKMVGEEVSIRETGEAIVISVME